MLGSLKSGKRINAHSFFKRLELRKKIWCDIVAQAKVVRANYGHQLHTVVKQKIFKFSFENLVIFAVKIIW